jgi:hypothetical protein
MGGQPNWVMQFWVQEHVEVVKQGTGWFLLAGNTTAPWIRVSNFKADRHFIAPTMAYAVREGISKYGPPPDRDKFLKELLAEIRLSGTGKIVYKQWFTSGVRPSYNPPGKDPVNVRVIPHSGFQITMTLTQNNWGDFILTVKKEGKYWPNVMDSIGPAMVPVFPGIADGADHQVLIQ